MNISDVNATSTPRTDLLKNNSVGTSGSVDSSIQGDATSDLVDDPADRVEISDEARIALSDARQSEELSFARTALESLPEMTEERIAELIDRIRSRYYQQADVLGNVSERVGDTLRNDV